MKIKKVGLTLHILKTLNKINDKKHFTSFEKTSMKLVTKENRLLEF